MNPHEQELYRQLVDARSTAAAGRLLRRTAQEFVLRYGWWYEPAALPEGIKPAPVGECHRNACDLAADGDWFVYCEGFALFRPDSLMTLHAWVTDGSGRAFDNTWPALGVAYAGVPFRTDFVTLTSLKNHAVVSLLDDWQNGYPLRGELGDRPGEWLETERGNGTARLVPPHEASEPHR